MPKMDKQKKRGLGKYE